MTYRCDRDLPQSPGPLVPYVPPTPAAIRQWCERYAPQYLERREDDGLPADVRRFLGEM